MVRVQTDSTDMTAPAHRMSSAPIVKEVKMPIPQYNCNITKWPLISLFFHLSLYFLTVLCTCFCPRIWFWLMILICLHDSLSLVYLYGCSDSSYGGCNVNEGISQTLYNRPIILFISSRLFRHWWLLKHFISLAYLTFRFEIIWFILHYGIWVCTCHLFINLLTFLKYI